MECPHCQSQKIVKNGKDYHQDGKAIQNYLCKSCGKRLNERKGTSMSRLKTPANIVFFALKMRTEGMGIRAKWESARKIPHKHYEMGAKIGSPVTAIESLFLIRSRYIAT
jgi:transposase-like protein